MYTATRPLPPRTAELLDFALTYVAAGIRVFPLHPVIAPGTPDVRCACPDGKDCGDIGKHPALPWVSKPAARTDRSVRAMFEALPGAGIGLVCGELFDVLDVDGAAGTMNLERALEQLGNPEILGVAHSGRPDGGQHLYLPAGTVPTGTALFGLSGIDGRGRGGYVVAPGSRHRTGAVYSWAAPMNEVLARISRRRSATPPPASTVPSEPAEQSDYTAGLSREEKLRAWAERLVGKYTCLLAEMEDGRRHEVARDTALKAGSLLLTIEYEGVPVDRERVESTLIGAAMKGGMGQAEAARMISQSLEFAYRPMVPPHFRETTADVAKVVTEFRAHGPALIETATIKKPDGSNVKPHKRTRDIAEKLISALADRSTASGSLRVRLPRRDAELLGTCSNTAATRAVNLLIAAELLEPTRPGSRKSGTGSEYRLCSIKPSQITAAKPVGPQPHQDEGITDARARGLTGTPRHIYAALITAGEPMSRREIADITGVGQETVRKSLDGLLAEGLVEQAEDGSRNTRRFAAAEPRAVAALTAARRETTVRERVRAERTRFTADLAVKAIRRLAAGKMLSPRPASIIETLADERRSTSAVRTLLSPAMFADMMDALSELYVRRAEISAADEMDTDDGQPMLVYGAVPAAPPPGHRIGSVAERIDLRRAIRASLRAEALNLGLGRQSPKRLAANTQLLRWAKMTGPLGILNEVVGHLLATSPYSDLESAPEGSNVVNLH